MRTTLRLALAPALALALGCKATPPPAAPQGPPGHMEHAMANCPSAVPGAATAMRAIDGGVVLDITAADPAAAQAIVERAHREVTMTPPDPARGQQLRPHGGPGDPRARPVVHVGTTVTVEDIAGGARVTVRTTDPAQAGALERETRERIEWLDPSSRPR